MLMSAVVKASEARAPLAVMLRLRMSDGWFRQPRPVLHSAGIRETVQLKGATRGARERGFGSVLPCTR